MGNSKNFIAYLAKFLAAFGILYYGTKFWIGLTVPGGYYSPFIHHYLDYIALFRKFLLVGAEQFLSIFGYKSHIRDSYFLQFQGGRSVHMVYSCLGYGLISFWIAFVFANNGNTVKKAKWMIGGVLLICFLNIIRISLLLLAINLNWSLFNSIDHHTMFNIAVYILIFGLIWLFDRFQDKRVRVNVSETDNAD